MNQEFTVVFDYAEMAGDSMWDMINGVMDKLQQIKEVDEESLPFGAAAQVFGDDRATMTFFFTDDQSDLLDFLRRYDLENPKVNATSGPTQMVRERFQDLDKDRLMLMMMFIAESVKGNK